MTKHDKNILKAKAIIERLPDCAKLDIQDFKDSYVDNAYSWRGVSMYLYGLRGAEIITNHDVNLILEYVTDSE